MQITQHVTEMNVAYTLVTIYEPLISNNDRYLTV